MARETEVQLAAAPEVVCTNAYLGVEEGDENAICSIGFGGEGTNARQSRDGTVKSTREDVVELGRRRLPGER